MTPSLFNVVEDLMALIVRGRLTPHGAQLLRAARDHMLTCPDEFDWGDWGRSRAQGCGTRCCIAGHVVLAAGEFADCPDIPRRASELLGFVPQWMIPRELHTLFGVYAPGDLGRAWGERYDVHAAAKVINDFLWQYGYPADEVTGEPLALTQPEQALECV